MTTPDRIKKLLADHGPTEARRILIQEHHPLDGTITAKLDTLDKLITE